MLKKIIVASLLSVSVGHIYATESLFLESGAVKNVRGRVAFTTPATSLASANSAQNASLNSPLNRPFVEDKTVLSFRADMRVNAKAFDAMEMNITLSDGGSVSLKRMNRYTTESGSIVWIGKSTNAKRGTGDYAEAETILVLRKGRVEGSVRHAGKLYLIHPAVNANHTLAEIDTRISRPDHNDREYNALPRIIRTVSSSVQKSKDNAKPEISEFDQEFYQAKATITPNSTYSPPPVELLPPVVRVLVNYTPAAKVNIVDPLAYADKLIADTNIMYWNSLINVRVALAYVEPVSYVETGDITQDVNNYKDNGDGFMDEIHTSRTLYKADVAILLTGKLPANICGQAAGIGSNKSTAFAIVEAGCANTQYSFAHEIGHLFGARHSEKEQGESLTTVPMYAHGYTTGQTNADRRSIMAKKINSADLSPRTNVFSNPTVKVKVNGVDRDFGTVDVNNNARMLNENALALASFNTAPARFPHERKWYIFDVTATDFQLGRFIIGNPNASDLWEAIPRLGTETITFSDFIVNIGMGARSRSISSATLNSLIELYIAFFNRVPESNGLYYWIGESARGQTINQIAESFYAAALIRPDLTGYKSTMSNEDFVRIVYKNVLGRNEVDASGLAYWTAALANGTESRGSLVSTILNVAHSFKNNGTEFAWVADLLDNKRTVGMYFSVQHGLAYKTDEDNIVKGMAIAAAVTKTDTSASIRLIGMNAQQWDFRWF